MAKGGQFEFEFRYIKGDVEKRIWMKSMIDLENNMPVLMKGSIRDVTSRHLNIQQLKDTQKLYAVGLELNNLGSWLWDLASGTLQWSKEMYTIFEVEENTPITLGQFLSYIHPDDKEKIINKIETIDMSIDKQEYTFKIIASGKEKILKGISKIETNGQKLITRCYGTCQIMER